MQDPADTDAPVRDNEACSSQFEPVQAHIDAALVPHAPYLPPLDALLTLGAPGTDAVAVQRSALPIGQTHVGDLVRMARDQALNTAHSDSAEVWAPLHALELLTQLDLSAVVADLVPLLDVDDDGFARLLPAIFVQAGPAALAPLRAYLSDRTRWTYGRSIAIDAVAQLAKQHPALRDAAVESLLAVLRDPADTDPSINGFLIASLLSLEAKEALPVMRAAFAAHWVDETISGGWGDVQTALGRTPDPADPLVAESARRRQARHDQFFPPELRQQLDALAAARPAARAPGPKAAKAHDQARKTKQKRKQTIASRKANRKQRK